MRDRQVLFDYIRSKINNINKIKILNILQKWETSCKKPEGYTKNYEKWLDTDINWPDGIKKYCVLRPYEERTAILAEIVYIPEYLYSWHIYWEFSCRSVVLHSAANFRDHPAYAKRNIMEYVGLSETGQLMPTVGLGTWQASPDVIESVVTTALKVGYRHIDTAFNYNNEEAIGKAIRKWLDDGGKRNDLFVTTKLPSCGNRAADVKYFLEMQLNRLQLDYVDLYLIHHPFSFQCDPATLTPAVTNNGEYDLDMETDHVATWKVMEECQREGLIRNLGVSNFNEQQIEKIIQNSEIKPQVSQVEVHAFFQQKKHRKFCSENNIVVTAYAPLGSPGARHHFVTKYKYSPEKFPDLLSLPLVRKIAEKYDKTVAQILLRFLVQSNVVVIPKSNNEGRLKENFDLYDIVLNPTDMESLESLDKGETGRIFNFLFWKGVERHPEYPFKLGQNKEGVTS